MLFQVMQNLPKKHQTLLFSATMPVEIEELAQVRFCGADKIHIASIMFLEICLTFLSLCLCTF